MAISVLDYILLYSDHTFATACKNVVQLCCDTFSLPEFLPLMRVVGYQPVVVAEAKIRFESSISEEG